MLFNSESYTTLDGGVHNNFPGYAGKRGTGAIYIPDSRDKQFMIADRINDAMITKASFDCKIKQEFVLDQGPYEYAPAYAWRLWYSASPGGTGLGPSAFRIYEASRATFSPILQEAYTFGTTLRACGKYFYRQGLVDSYWWADTWEEIRIWLLSGNGPVILATDWYEAMDINYGRTALPQGKLIGRNAYIGIGWSDQHHALRIMPARGNHWGENGKKWLNADNLQSLLDNHGECCIPDGKNSGAHAKRISEIRATRSAIAVGHHTTERVPAGVDRSALNARPSRAANNRVSPSRASNNAASVKTMIKEDASTLVDSITQEDEHE